MALFRSTVTLLTTLMIPGCGGGGSAASGGAPTGGGGGSSPLGDWHEGSYNLGPVAFDGSFPNSCAPYTSDLEQAAGPYLAGVGLAYNGDGSLCDACIEVVTRLGKSVTAQVITTGETVGENDVDLSQAAYDLIHQDDPQGTVDVPRPMKWRLVSCPVQGNIEYQFQTGANVWWTSLWARNIRVAVEKLEVKSTNHTSFVALQRGSDGTLTDASGFGDGPFTLRATAIDGQQVTDTFPSFTPGELLDSGSQFH